MFFCLSSPSLLLNNVLEWDSVGAGLDPAVCWVFSEVLGRRLLIPLAICIG